MQIIAEKPDPYHPIDYSLVQLPPGFHTLTLQIHRHDPISRFHVWFPTTLFLISYRHNQMTQTFQHLNSEIYFAPPLPNPPTTLHKVILPNVYDSSVCMGNNFLSFFNSKQKLLQESINHFFHSTFTENYTQIPLTSGQIIQTLYQWKSHSKKTPIPIDFSQLQKIPIQEIPIQELFKD